LIHQFIFAGPKPGLSAEAFQGYWVNFHAVDYAAKIPQIRQYLVATRLPLALPRQLPFFEGVAEIWLANEAEQLASLQSPEFVHGARADEPRWAAFWQTLALDTDPEMIVGEAASPPGGAYAKLYRLLKRPPTMTRPSFREALLVDRRGRTRLTHLACHLVGFCRGGLYDLGEPRFDAVEVMGFADRAALEDALESGLRDELRVGWPFVHPDYHFGFTGQENWVIRPGER
jgi:hypothetical protein